MTRANYHTHTPRCCHASGVDADYVEAAIKAEYDILGFSDHCPWPFTDWFNVKVRMDWDILPEYIASIRSLAESYKDSLTVLCGLEAEYFPAHVDALRVMASQVDYMILGQHYDCAAEKLVFVGETLDLAYARRYVDQCAAAFSTGLFSYLAHPDMFLLSHTAFTPELASYSRELCRAARAYDIPLEVNLYGVRKQLRKPWPHYPTGLGYPCVDFWRIAAEEGCTAIVGVDAHKPEALLDPELHLMASMFVDGLGMKRLETLNLPCANRG